MTADLIKALVLFVTCFLETSLAILFWLKGRSKESILLGWVAVFSASYCFASGGLFFLPNPLFWYRFAWSGIFIIPSAFAFAYYSTGRAKHLVLKTLFLYLIALAIFILALFTPYFVKSVNPITFRPQIGDLEYLGRIFIIIGGSLGLYYLYRAYIKSSDEYRWKAKIFLLGVGITYIGSFIAAGIIPLIYPQYGYSYVSPMFTLPGIVLITYAIFKEKLFEIRLIVTEILVGTMGAVLLIQALLAETLARQAFGFFILFIFLIIGYIMINVTEKEIKRTEETDALAKELKKLNETLEEKVEKRTKELKKSYHEIKERNEELERFYELVVGRELDMIKMKEELKKLKKG